MDHSQEDVRLAELREALRNLPTQTPESDTIKAIDIHGWDAQQLSLDFSFGASDAISALSTDQIAALTTSTIPIPSPNFQTSILSGHSVDFESHPQPATLELQGENADVVVNGVSLMETLRQIQRRLNILEPNAGLESEWQELRELGDRYRALEKKILEQNALLNTLKTMPEPEDFL